MEMSSQRIVSGDDALAMAALYLMGEGATATDLAERFAAAGATIDRPRVAALLERLVALGLVYTPASRHHEPFYAPSALGQGYSRAALAGQADLTARLQELEHLRTDLLATVAHELRTPLTAIRTCVGLLLDPDTSPDAAARAQLLQTIERSSDRMQRVLADLLDLARFRAGRVQLQLRRFDAREIARDTAAVMAAVLRERRQTLDVVAPETPVWVYGDHRRLEQVVLNLLSNAHKFSPDGALVRLEVRAAGDTITWAVTDQGPGIAPDDQPRLFERFFTAAGRAGGSQAGTGLGLPIAMLIALAHGGTITVETAVGEGSTFTLRVPAEGPPESGEP
jgi:signal transduction histidine kinase